MRRFVLHTSYMCVPTVSHFKLTILRDKEIYPESHILNVVEPEFKVNFSDFKARAPNHYIMLPHPECELGKFPWGLVPGKLYREGYPSLSSRFTPGKIKILLIAQSSWLSLEQFSKVCKPSTDMVQNIIPPNLSDLEMVTFFNTCTGINKFWRYNKDALPQPSLSSPFQKYSFTQKQCTLSTMDLFKLYSVY